MSKMLHHTLPYSIVHLIHIEIFNIRGKDAVEQLEDTVSDPGILPMRVFLKHTTFKTSLPGSSHHIVE